MDMFPLFMQMYEEAGADDDLDTWWQFLNTFYPEDVSGQHDKAFWDDMRRLFYEYSGLTDDNIDWDLWRSIIEEISPGGA